MMHKFRIQWGSEYQIIQLLKYSSSLQLTLRTVWFSNDSGFRMVCFCNFLLPRNEGAFLPGLRFTKLFYHCFLFFTHQGCKSTIGINQLRKATGKRFTQLCNHNLSSRIVLMRKVPAIIKIFNYGESQLCHRANFKTYLSREFLLDKYHPFL